MSEVDGVYAAWTALRWVFVTLFLLLVVLAGVIVLVLRRKRKGKKMKLADKIAFFTLGACVSNLLFWAVYGGIRKQGWTASEYKPFLVLQGATYSAGMLFNFYVVGFWLQGIQSMCLAEANFRGVSGNDQRTSKLLFSFLPFLFVFSLLSSAAVVVLVEEDCGLTCGFPTLFRIVAATFFVQISCIAFVNHSFANRARTLLGTLESKSRDSESSRWRTLKRKVNILYTFVLVACISVGGLKVGVAISAITDNPVFLKVILAYECGVEWAFDIVILLLVHGSKLKDPKSIYSRSKAARTHPHTQGTSSSIPITSASSMQNDISNT